MSERATVAYIYVSENSHGWFWESRDCAHERIDGKGNFKTSLKAAQDGADAHPPLPDSAGIEVRVGHDPVTGE